MARQKHTIARTSGSYPSLPPTPGTLNIPLKAADIANGEECPFTQGVTVVASNRGAMPSRVTIESCPGRDNRSGDIVYDLPGETAAAFGPFQASGWIQQDGTLHFKADNQTVWFGAVIAVR